VEKAHLLLQSLAEVLSPGVWQVVGEPALVALVVVTVVAAGAGLWLLGRALADGRSELEGASDRRASSEGEQNATRPADSPLARLRTLEVPAAHQPALPVAPAPAAARPAAPVAPAKAPAKQPPRTDESDAIDLVFQKAWQGKLVPRAGHARPPRRDLAPPPTPETDEGEPAAPPGPPVRKTVPRPEPPPAVAPAAEALARSLGEAWERAFVATAEPASPAPLRDPTSPASVVASEARDEAPQPAPVDQAPAPDPAPSPDPALDATDPSEHVRLAELLVARGRFEEAARLAREGLAAHPGTSELLLLLSRAEAELGHLDAAIAAAHEAHRQCRTRASLTQLLRLLGAARRFTPEDGERLRRAVQKHPETPVLLHAAGVFEATHGNPWAAIGLLRTALRLESDPGIRSEIERELARL
jgi:hypothetical protein